MFQKLVFLVPLWVMLGLQDTIFSTSYTVAGTLKARRPSHYHTNVNPFTPSGFDASVYDPKLTTKCEVPPVAKTITVSKPILIGAGKTFDCQYAKYQSVDTSCNLDREKGEEAAVFILEDGATLKRCHLGFSQESVYCLGTCHIEDCHWLEICDEAITFDQKSGTSVVSGCSFSNGGNKALQFDGSGTINVINSCFYNIDIAYRSCGTGGGCPSTKRDAVFEGIEIIQVNTLAGFNHFQGDTVSVRSYSAKGAGTMCEDKKSRHQDIPPGCFLA